MGSSEEDMKLDTPCMSPQLALLDLQHMGQVSRTLRKVLGSWVIAASVGYVHAGQVAMSRQRQNTASLLTCASTLPYRQEVFVPTGVCELHILWFD